MEGSDQSSLELGEVEVKISKFALYLSTPSTLIIQNSMKSVRIKAGEEFSLICEAYGRPTPNILWYKNNLQIKRQWFHYSFVNYGIRIINSGTSELKYQFVSTNDSGNYTCHAQNIYGHVQKSIHIEVFYLTSTESVTTRHVSSMDTTGEFKPVSNSKIMKDTTKSFINLTMVVDMVHELHRTNKPCFSDLDCLRNSCKENNSISRNLSYKTCVCSGKNDLPKCQTIEFARKDIFSNDEKLEQNPFQFCKDGCDPSISRLFLLSVLSLLLFLFVLFLVMIFITRKQRSKFKRNYSSNKINCNSDSKNQSRHLIEKNGAKSDPSNNNAEPYFSWDMVNPVIYLDDSKYFTIHPSKMEERFCYLENRKNVHLSSNYSTSEYPIIETKILSSSLTKEDNHHIIFQNNSDSHPESPFINKDKTSYMVSNKMNNNLNIPLQNLKDTSSLLIM